MLFRTVLSALTDKCLGRLQPPTLSTGAQDCVLSPLQFTLLTHDCTALHDSNHIIKYTDDTTVVGLTNKNDESSYREEVEQLITWCKVNHLSVNVDKTKEMVVDYRRAQRDHEPLNIHGSTVEIMKSTKFLGVHLAVNLTWSLKTFHCEESPAASPLPEKAEKSPLLTPNSHHFLQRDYREPPG